MSSEKKQLFFLLAGLFLAVPERSAGQEIAISPRGGSRPATIQKPPSQRQKAPPPGAVKADEGGESPADRLNA